MTITEGLAEIKTIKKRLAEKRFFILGHLHRPANVVDPITRQGNGSSQAVVQSEMQAMNDLLKRIVDIRRAIRQANEETTVIVNKNKMSIADWLTWRRDCAPEDQATKLQINSQLSSIRTQLGKQGRSATSNEKDAKAEDFIIHLNEVVFAERSEAMERTLGELDGALSMMNATVQLKGV